MADDDGLAAVRLRMAELPVRLVRDVAVLLVAGDAALRAAEGALHSQEPSRDLGAFTAALDDAAALSEALGSIDDLDGLVRGVFDALSDVEARLLVFERAFRALAERRAS